MKVDRDKWYVHVNQPRIRANIRALIKEPVIRVQKGPHGKPEYAFDIRFEGGRIFYKPEGEPILKCGARLVIECDRKPEIIA